MESVFRYIAEPSTCGYLKDQQWSLEYEYFSSMTGRDYLQRMLEGWRHFGPALFRPACSNCNACRSIRIPVDRFSPNRSQKRNARQNGEDIELQIGIPTVDQARLDLYDRFHAFQTENKGWPEHPAKDPSSYFSSFVDSAFPPEGMSRDTGSVEEWCYFLRGKLVGVGYVDFLPPAYQKSNGREAGISLPVIETTPNGEPLAGGLSAIYFFHDPEHRNRGLGVWNVLSLIENARHRNLPYVYLGYYVEGCASMSYKPNFEPNQILAPDGKWLDYRN